MARLQEGGESVAADREEGGRRVRRAGECAAAEGRSQHAAAAGCRTEAEPRERLVGLERRGHRAEGEAARAGFRPLCSSRAERSPRWRNATTTATRTTNESSESEK